jgi:dolichol-phosphate mannosyltransferase
MMLEGAERCDNGGLVFLAVKKVMMTRFSVILPTFNEAANITVLVHAVPSAISSGGDHEILVVDDHSPDGTYHVVPTHLNDPRVVPILRTKDRGFAKSTHAGLESGPRIDLGARS